MAKEILESATLKCVKVLFDAGAHIDLANEKEFSALNILKRRETENCSDIFPLINRVLPLKCCFANVIRQKQIPFETLSHSEKTFVRRRSQLHSIPISIRFPLIDSDEDDSDSDSDVNSNQIRISIRIWILIRIIILHILCY